MSEAIPAKRTCNSSNEEELELRRGPWTLEEDTLLIHYITSHGEGRWNFLAKFSGTTHIYIYIFDHTHFSIKISSITTSVTTKTLSLSLIFNL